MPSQVYDIPIIQPDLRREETIHQIADTLEYLEKIANDVFDRIEKRVTENHTQLTTINKRLDVAQAKVDKIKNSRKAIKVFSSSKYPAPEKNDVYQSVFADNTDLSSIPRPSRKLANINQPAPPQGKAINKLAAMIPPPPRPMGGGGLGDDDDDWD